MGRRSHLGLTWRRLVLLAALAAAGQKGMSRDALVGLFWPEVDASRARAALSQALYALKRDSGVGEIVLGYDVLTLNSGIVSSSGAVIIFMRRVQLLA